MNNNDNDPYLYNGDIAQMARYFNSGYYVALPKVLFEDEFFINELSSHSKLIYGHIISDYLSKKVSVDYAKRYYVKYPLAEIESNFDLCHSSAVEHLKRLCDTGYLEKKSLGKGRGDNIYLKNRFQLPTPILKPHEIIDISELKTG